METKHRLIFKVLSLLLFLFIFSNLTERVSAAQVLTNPSFTGGTTGWTLTGSYISYSSVLYNNSSGSVYFGSTGTLARDNNAKQSIVTTIYQGSTGTLSFNYSMGISCNDTELCGESALGDKKNHNTFAEFLSKFIEKTFAQEVPNGYSKVSIQIQRPGESPLTWTNITTINVTNPTSFSKPYTGSWPSSGQINISSYLTGTGTYSFRVLFEGFSPLNSLSSFWALVDDLSINITSTSGPWGVTYTKNISAAGNITSPTTNPIAVNNASTSPTPTVTTNSGYTFNNYSVTSGTCGGTFTASTGVCSSVTGDITIQANWTAVSNTAPTITQTPFELTASTATAPTTIGSAITFRATATDTANSYYLVICSTNSVTPGSGGAAPTCGGTRYCVSSATASGVQASCSYTTISGNAWSNAWYAFACDNNTSSLCSTVSQGSGDSGSPFYVNHAPAFTASAVSAAVNPGGTITWTTTASDPDGNTIQLLVCKTAAMSAGSCTGGSWCTSSLSASNPTCNYVATAPYADGAYNAYPYIVDQFDLASSGAAQGVLRAFTVNNVAPTVGTVTLNGGAAISLTESTTTAIATTAVVTDTNGCTNLSATAEVPTVKGYLYRSGITYAGCDTVGEANNNYCYPESTCSVSVACSAGVTTYSCPASVQFYADPTDLNSQYPTEKWASTVKATDDDSAVGTGADLGKELNSLLAGNTTPTTLNFGSLAIGESNDPLDKILTTTPTGNVGLDILVKASTASLCTNYPTCTGGTPIPITHQKYARLASTAYSSGTAVSTTDVEAELNVPKQTTSTPPSKQTWWGIAIPTGTLPGVYNGLNVITYKLGETANW